MARLGVIASIGKDWKASVERVRIAEELGYEHAAVGEAWGASAIPFLALLGAGTQRITLGTSILNCFSRTPAVLAQEFAVLDLISGGRTVLGIGSSGANVIEHFHGISFERPLQRIRETVEIFRTLISGGPARPRRRDLSATARIPARRRPAPGQNPGLDRRTHPEVDSPDRRDRRRHHPDPLAPAALRGASNRLGVGGRRGRANNASFTIAPFTTVNVLDGVDDEAKWLDARQILWFYINRMGVFYWQMLVERGYEEEVAACRSAYARRDYSAALAAVSERMVRDLQCIGSIEEVREQLSEHAAAGADLQLIYMPRGDVAQTARQLEALIT